MATDHSASIEKRQAILQRLREQRASRGTIANQQQDAVGLSQEMTQDEHGLEAQDLLISDLSSVVEENRASLTADNFLDGIANLELQHSSVQNQEVSPPSSSQKSVNKQKALPIEFLKSVQQLINSPEVDPNSTSLQELEQRQQELQYRATWLFVLLEAIQDELRVIQNHMKNKKESL